LLRGLAGRNLEAVDARRWARLIDWLLPLPEAEAREFQNQLQVLEKEGTMPYVTSWEQMGYDRGRKEGLQEGRQEGLKKALAVALEIRFGAAAAAALVAAVPTEAGVENLERLLEAAKEVASPDEFRAQFA